LLSKSFETKSKKIKEKRLNKTISYFREEKDKIYNKMNNYIDLDLVYKE